MPPMADFDGVMEHYQKKMQVNYQNDEKIYMFQENCIDKKIRKIVEK